MCNKPCQYSHVQAILANLVIGPCPDRVERENYILDLYKGKPFYKNYDDDDGDESDDDDNERN